MRNCIIGSLTNLLGIYYFYYYVKTYLQEEGTKIYQGDQEVFLKIRTDDIRVDIKLNKATGARELEVFPGGSGYALLARETKMKMPRKNYNPLSWSLKFLRKSSMVWAPRLSMMKIDLSYICFVEAWRKYI
jgi:hypothetical protein